MRGGCSAADPNLDETNFARPLPWIGLYVTAASLLFALLMSLDLIHGLRKRKHWFPCRWFPLNATTLTILAIATKFPVDLNTPMPGQLDQLSKLTSTILICAVMANFMPSLGSMDSSGVVSNVVALGILVITVVVNICIQMGTGVIYVFWVEHILAMAFMLVLLALLAASALPVPTTKEIMENEFQAKYGNLIREREHEREDDLYNSRNLEEVVERFWLMAHTSSPQYVIGRLATCVASGAFSFLGAVVAIEAFVRSKLQRSMFCGGVSDYGWSTELVFYSQLATILIGTVGPAYRWISVISLRSMESRQWRWAEEFTVEVYWTKQLKDWKDGPLSFDNTTRRWRKGKYVVKSFLLDMLIKLQEIVVFLGKLVRLLPILTLSCLTRRKRNPIAPESLKKYVLHLEGEEELVDTIARSEQKDVKKWIEKGKKEEPAELIALIKENPQEPQRGFEKVARIFSSRDCSWFVSEGHEEPINSWAMPIVTLVAIAIAIPNVPKGEKKLLLKAVYQGLKYVRLIEKHLDCRGLTYARKEAEILWKTMEMNNRWLDKDLQPQDSDADGLQRIRDLAEIGFEKFQEFWKEETRREEIRDCIEWPGKAMAAYTMYKIATSITYAADRVEDGRHVDPRSECVLFEWIRETISDTINACLANMPRAVHEECINTRIEDLEEKITNAAFLLGEVKDNILPIFAEKKDKISHPTDNGRPYIDKWIEVTTGLE